MFRTKPYVNFRLGTDAVLWIDPGKVDGYVGTHSPTAAGLRADLDRLAGRHPALRGPLRMLRGAIPRMDPVFVIRARHYRTPVPITGIERYRHVEDLLRHRDRVEESLWFGTLSRQLAERGVAVHKEIRMHSREDILRFFRTYALDLVDSMERTGYDPARAPDTATALIGPGGEVHKAYKGNHRFCVARLLGVRNVPVHVWGVHEDWFAREVGPRMDIPALRRALGAVQERYA